MSLHCPFADQNEKYLDKFFIFCLVKQEIKGDFNKEL